MVKDWEMKQTINDFLPREPLSLEQAAVLATLLQTTDSRSVQELLLKFAAENGSVEELWALADFYEENGRFKKYVKCLEKAYELGHDEAAMYIGQEHFFRAKSLDGKARRREYKKALEWFAKVPEFPSVPLKVALAHLAVGHREDAYEVLLENKDRDAEAAVEAVHRNIVPEDEAIALLESHLENGALDVLIPLADLYLEAGRTADARAALERSYEAGEPHARVNLGYVLWDEGNHDRAIELWQEAKLDNDKLAKYALKLVKRGKLD